MKIFVRIFSLIGFIFGFTMMIFSLTTDQTLVVANYVFENALVDENLNGLKIVQLSDFHNHGLNYKNGYLPDLVKSQNPDLIFLTGDFIDQYTTDDDINNLKILFDEISDIPTYYIVGNHEFYARHNIEFYDLIYSHQNISFLFDNYVKVYHNGSSFNLIGLRDPYRELLDNAAATEEDEMEAMEPTISRLTSYLDDDLKILLSHRPTMMKLYAKYKMDLIFSGHTHGGQMSFIKKFEYQSGLYHLDNSTIIVSNGMGYNGKMPVRVNCPMQLVTCTLKSL